MVPLSRGGKVKPMALSTEQILLALLGICVVLVSSLAYSATTTLSTTSTTGMACDYATNGDAQCDIKNYYYCIFNKCTLEKSYSTTQTTCSESDKSLDEFNYGSVKYTHRQSNGYYNTGSEVFDNCVDSSTLNERVCNTTFERGKLPYVDSTVKCQYGCSNGKCNPTTPTATPTTTSTTDTKSTTATPTITPTTTSPSSTQTTNVTPTTVPSCTDGSLQCSPDGVYLQKCVSGSWLNSTKCDYGCSSNACKQPPTSTCSEGSIQCSSDSLYLQKCVSGSLVNSSKCDYGCADKACKAAPTVCTEGSLQCASDGFYLQKCVSGAWIGSTKCANGCYNGACKTTAQPSLCKDGSLQCSQDGLYVQKCVEGKWLDSTKCSSGCSNGACKQLSTVETCKDGTLQCSHDGNFIQKCSLGKWVDSAKCALGCVNNACRTTTAVPIVPKVPEVLCKDGSFQCSVDGLYTQKCVSGNWVDSTRCSFGCKEGKCGAKPIALPALDKNAIKPTDAVEETKKKSAEKTCREISLDLRETMLEVTQGEAVHEQDFLLRDCDSLKHESEMDEIVQKNVSAAQSHVSEIIFIIQAAKKDVEKAVERLSTCVLKAEEKDSNTYLGLGAEIVKPEEFDTQLFPIIGNPPEKANGSFKNSHAMLLKSLHAKNNAARISAKIGLVGKTAANFCNKKACLTEKEKTERLSYLEASLKLLDAELAAAEKAVVLANKASESYNASKSELKELCSLMAKGEKITSEPEKVSRKKERVTIDGMQVVVEKNDLGQGIVKGKLVSIVADEKGAKKAVTTASSQELLQFDSSGLSETAGVYSLKIEEDLNRKYKKEGYVGEIEESLQTIGEDQQLAQIDLQNTLQYSQQLIQTMSNVSKLMYDAEMAIIRNIGG